MGGVFGIVITGGIMIHLTREAEEQIREAWEEEPRSNKIV